MADMVHDEECPVCHRVFKNKKGRNSHLSTARSCSWYRQGKLRALDTGEFEGGHLDGLDKSSEPIELPPGNIEEDPEYVQYDFAPNDVYHFIPPEPAPSFQVGSSQDIVGDPGPSTQAAQAAAHTQARFLDDDEDDRVEDVNMEAGKVIRFSDTLYEAWAKRFSQDDPEDVEMASDSSEAMDPPQQSSNPFYPFASQIDWQIAHWFVKENPGHGAFDRLLQIPGVGSTSSLVTLESALLYPSLQVRERLGLSYTNVRSLHQIVDSIPDRAGQWYIKNLNFRDRLEEKHTIRFRNILEIIRCLWGDPALSQYMVYRPSKIFSDQRRNNRIYSEMWTGSWWHAVQVCLTLAADIYILY